MSAMSLTDASATPARAGLHARHILCRAIRYAGHDEKSSIVSVPHRELTFNLFSYPLFENKLEVVGVPRLGGTTTLQKGGLPAIASMSLLRRSGRGGASQSNDSSAGVRVRRGSGMRQ